MTSQSNYHQQLAIRDVCVIHNVLELICTNMFLIQLEAHSSHQLPLIILIPCHQKTSHTELPDKPTTSHPLRYYIK